MKITEIRYKRVFNCGNYENEQIEAVAEVEEGEIPEVAMELLKQFVMLSSNELAEREKREAEMKRRLEENRKRREAEMAEYERNKQAREEDEEEDEEEEDYYIADNDETEEAEEIGF